MSLIDLRYCNTCSYGGAVGQEDIDIRKRNTDCCTVFAGVI